MKKGCLQLHSIHILSTHPTQPQVYFNMLKIKSLDHLVLTVKSIPKTIKFYESILGMESQTFVSPVDPTITRYALKFGVMKLNLHALDSPFKPHAKNPLNGTADLCFLLDDANSSVVGIKGVIDHLNQLEVPIEIGPVERSGANGKIESVYIRDPDENLIEISKYI
ncbi:glyoxalase domain-containing protein 5-like protein [Scheffersomyces coipomensis]|uniref:glyoxalase domain-containing protein 5-like protein n=1 Tax=Scheffersomyces coipomensis TaxID=1788519 RepID=UPI00315D7A41